MHFDSAKYFLNKHQTQMRFSQKLIHATKFANSVKFDLTLVFSTV